MRQLKHTNTPEPGVWHEVSSDQVRDWRRSLGKGVVRQDSIGRRNLQPVDAAHGDSGAVSATPRRSWVEPREVIDNHVTSFLTDLHRLKGISESAFLDRVRKLRAMAGWDHLSDEEAADQLAALAEKVATAITEPVYQKMGKLRAQDLDRVGAGKFTGAVLLPGQEGR
ncbi:MAG: hypothetical protein OEW91_10705 [Acidimicrobiia bacterium]|nr:hypothetical protein [Acidimicrobiia bacterium]